MGAPSGRPKEGKDGGKTCSLQARLNGRVRGKVCELAHTAFSRKPAAMRPALSDRDCADPVGSFLAPPGREHFAWGRRPQ